MYVRFKILKVEAVLGEKAILIESTHEIDPHSIKPENIRIKYTSDPLFDLRWDHYEIHHKSIKLFLTEYPKINTPYTVYLSQLKNLIDDTLETQFYQTIVFLGITRSEISFIKPIMHSKVPELCVEIEERLINDYVIGADQFEYELSEDALFLSDNLTLEKQVIKDKKITWALSDYNGQIFIRCRGVYREDEKTYYSDWVHTTCIIAPTLENQEPYPEALYQLTLKIIETPQHNSAKQNFSYTFNGNPIESVESVEITAEPLITTDKTTFVVHNTLLIENQILFVLPIPLPKNAMIHVKMKNIKAGHRTLDLFEHCFYSLLDTCYATAQDVKTLIGFNGDIDDQLIYYQLIEASKLADYYVAVQPAHKRFIVHTEEQIDHYAFEKNMFVKYYVAGQLFSQIRASAAYDSRFSGKLGEIEFTPKGSLLDLAQTLDDFNKEANKWKLALQGHKDYPAMPKSAIKSKKHLSYKQNRGR